MALAISPNGLALGTCRNGFAELALERVGDHLTRHRDCRRPEARQSDQRCQIEPFDLAVTLKRNDELLMLRAGVDVVTKGVVQMVAYSFKRQFGEPISTGAKRQTVRADRKRHARQGEQLQLYTGMRTRQCRLIGTARCADVSKVILRFDDADPKSECVMLPDVTIEGRALDGFAQADGFANWAGLKTFWRANHPGVDHFEGVLIRWVDFSGAGR